MFILDICQATLTKVGQRPRVRWPPNTEYDERFIAPAFKGACTSVMFWGAVAYGYHSPLVAIRKRTRLERTHAKDRLGFNAIQYCQEILGPHLVPLLRRVSSSIESLEVIEDGAPCHTAKMTRQYRLQQGIRRIPWPASSPDLNLIENIWGLLKGNLRRQWRNPCKRPHNQQELIVAAGVTWDDLPWNRIYGWYHIMPVRVLTVIRRGGRSTRW